MEQSRNVYKVTTPEPGGKRPLGRPSHVCENAERDITDSQREHVNSIHLAQAGDWWWVLVNMVTNFQLP
jgi:hypothetical protein